MEYFCFEVDFWGCNRVLACQYYPHVENSAFIGSITWAFDKCLPHKEISLIKDEQIVIKFPLGSISSLFHKSLPVHGLKYYKVRKIQLKLYQTIRWMGSQQSKEKKEQKIQINHYKFKKAKFIKEEDIIRNQLVVESDADFEIWERKLNKVANIEDQIFLFPRAYQYTRKAICGSSGIVEIDYDNYQYILLEELKNRQKVKRHFNELQIWYLLYCLISASYELKQIGSKIGDVRPQNIFINQQGHIKIGNLFSWPGQMTNYSKTVLNNQKTYLSPEELVSAKQGVSESYIDIFKAESFSIGLTLLESAILNDMGSLYLPTKELDFDKLNRNLKQWWSLKFRDQKFQGNVQTQYSDALKLSIASLCQVDKSKRMTCQELFLWLKPFHSKIVELKQFIPGLPPVKNIEKYSNCLNMNGKQKKITQPSFGTPISLGNRNNQYYISKPEAIKLQPASFDKKTNSRHSFEFEKKIVNQFSGQKTENSEQSRPKYLHTTNYYKIGEEFFPNLNGQKKWGGVYNSPEFLQKVDNQILVSKQGFQ